MPLAPSGHGPPQVFRLGSSAVAGRRGTAVEYRREKAAGDGVEDMVISLSAKGLSHGRMVGGG